MIIRNQSISDEDPSFADRWIAQFRNKVFNRTNKRRKTKMPKLTTFAAYGGVFVAIIAVIAVGYQAPQPTTASSVASATQTPVVTPDGADKQPSVDKIIATDVAANLAEQTNMPVAANVANLSVSLTVENQLAQTDDTAIIKPQIVQPTASSRDIVTYIVKKGDSVPSIAAAYGVTPETIRWANDLMSNTVSAGKKLKIPPVDGIVYTVKANDSLDGLANTYSTSKARIISFNNLEISGLVPGSQIVIPGGVLPETQRPGYQEPISTGFSYGGESGYRVNSSIRGASAGNRYAWGNCTWYAFERRQQMGRPIGSFWGNARTWAYFAQMDGYSVNRTPAVGAVLVDTAGYFGHVAVVESVKSNGDIVISEMNNYAYGGYGIVNKRTISAGQAHAYQYVH